MKTVIKKCIYCDYKLELPITEEQSKMLEKGELVQNVLKNVKPEHREMFISGICGTCWDKFLC